MEKKKSKVSFLPFNFLFEIFYFAGAMLLLSQFMPTLNIALNVSISFIVYIGRVANVTEIDYLKYCIEYERDEVNKRLAKLESKNL